MTELFVVDNSVVMSWCFREESNSYTDSVLEKLMESEAVVPSIWPLEVANVLLVAERMRRISQADSLRFTALLLQLPITVEYESPDRVMKDLLALGRATNLSSYDACYLDLAMRKGLPLATSDKKMRKAADSVRVPILGT